MGVDPSAFRSAHLKLAQELHPDRYSDAPKQLAGFGDRSLRSGPSGLGSAGRRRKEGHIYRSKDPWKEVEDELAMEQLQPLGR